MDNRNHIEHTDKYGHAEFKNDEKINEILDEMKRLMKLMLE